MKKNVFGTCVALMLAAGIILGGCATTPEITKIKDVKNLDTYSGGYLDKLLVVGKPRVEANRVQYENHIAGVLSKKKVEVIPSHTVIPGMAGLTRDSVKQAAVDAGAGAVLVTVVVGVDEKEVVIKQPVVYRGRGMGAYLDVTRVETFTRVRLETGLFEVKTEKLIWAATSAIMNPDTADEAIKDFSAAITQQLKKDGYIR
jgi:hypothetical protein